MARRLLSVFLIFFPLICLHIASGRPYNGQTFGSPVPVGFNTAINLPDVTGGQIISSNSVPAGYFSDIMYRRLAESKDFERLFSEQINADQVMNIAISISQALTAQTTIKDPYFATNQLFNALSSINPGAGHQLFARVIANCITQILQSNGILNAGNSLFLANLLTPTIINAVVSVTGDVDVGVGVNIGLPSGIGSTTQVGTPFIANGRNFLGVSNDKNAKVGANKDNFLQDIKDINIDVEDLFDEFDLNENLDSVVNIGLGAGVGLNTNLGLDANADNVLNVGAGIGIGTDTRTSAGAKSGAASNVGTKTGVNLGIGTRTGLGAKVGAGANVDTKTSVDLGIGTRTGLGAKVGAGADLGTKTGVGLGIGTRADVDAKVGAGVDLGTKTGVGLGANTNVLAGADLGVGAGLRVGAGLNTDISAGLDVDSAVGIEIGLNDDTDVNFGLDTGITSDLINVFKTALTKELLRDKYFRYMFSEYVPIPALNLVTATIAQYLTKAFSLPRSVFLPLEKNILALSVNKTLTLESYADITATTVSAILSNLKIITSTAARLQITMAANAISSGISNFLGISAVSGLGLSITSNSYSSFFSLLNGLEKLPYVGADAVSQTLPPILKTAKATSFALQFCKNLYNNLVSSRIIYESFSYGVPASSYKTISNTLGKYVAEAFGSRSSSFIADIYTNALLKTIGNLSYKTYARTLSLATTRALYLLGYFLSGNTNIQAAIATNAILKALKTRVLKKTVVTQVALFPGVLGLPWTTQLAGVAPSNSLLKGKGGVGVDVCANVGAGVGLNADIGANAGIKLDVGRGLDVGVGMDAGLGLGLDARAGVDTGKRLGLDADIGVDAGIGLRSDIGKRKSSGIGLDVGVGLGANIGVDTGIGLVTNGRKENRPVGLGAEIGLDAGVGIGTRTGLGLDRKKGRRSDSELNGSKRTSRQKRDLLSDIDIYADLENLDLGADLGVEVDTGIGSRSDGRKRRLGVGLDAGTGIDAGIRLGLDEGIGVDAELELDTNVDFDLGMGLGLDASIDADAGIGLDANVDVDAGIGLDANVGVNAGLGLGLGSDDARSSGIGINTNLGVGLGVNNDENPPGPSLTVLQLLPKILSDKFYKSTALYTSFSMVGPRKVINLIAQGMAVQFGFPVASIFLISYDKYIARNSENDFVSSMMALANATGDALAEAGMLNSTFSVLKVNELAIAVTAKYSSLIATSLETREWNIKSKLPLVYNPDILFPCIV